MTFGRLLAVTAASAAFAAAASSLAVAQDSPTADVSPVTDEMLLNPPDGDWLMWRRTYNGWGYSPLDQINKDNVGELRVAWSWELTPGIVEITPLVHDGVVFIYNYGGRIEALDGATGDQIWEYEHTMPDEMAGGFIPMRSMAIYGDNLIVATNDDHLLAIEADTGKLVWDKQVSDWSKGWRFTTGPIIAHGKIIQGTTGCDSAQPGGCFFTGHDVNTGEEHWRVYTIARPGTPEGNSWNGLPLESRHGGSAWHAGAYDPEQNLFFAGVGQPYPWIAEMSGLLPRSSDPNVTNEALFTDATMAIDVDTGELKWHYQHLPNDSIDLDEVYERMLIELPVDGQERKTVVSTGKLGIIEALDRTTGQWLWAKETVPQNVVASIDPTTGEKTINDAAIPHIGETTQNCPADPGGRGWPATAYSPRTQALYLPLTEFCSNTTPEPLDPGQIYTGGGRATFVRVQVPGSDGNIGRIDAINLGDQSTMWSHRQRASFPAAVLPTAGGLLFAADINRWMYAFDDETGEILWKMRGSNSATGFPVSYLANGKQYVAFITGGGSGVHRSWGSLTPEIKNPTDRGATLWVLSLPD
jgi:alcohol dehydrogenase (cytochrome c)